MGRKTTETFNITKVSDVSFNGRVAFLFRDSRNVLTLIQTFEIPESAFGSSLRGEHHFSRILFLKRSRSSGLIDDNFSKYRCFHAGPPPVLHRPPPQPLKRILANTNNPSASRN